jgi:acetoin utilization deacetylase AcuC-like enzyme
VVFLTALVYSEDYKNHDTGNHVENQNRVQVIMQTVEKMNLLDSKDIYKPNMVGEEDLLRVHYPEHVEKVRTFCENGGGYLDFDTAASPLTYNTAKLSAGGAIKAAELVLSGENNAYSIGRPPGHHATRNKAMGFCIFNNLAVTLEYLRQVKKIEKFLIFDFDVHYGNGTAEIFYEDPQVLYISIHQDPRTLFPGSGFKEEIGRGEGEGTNLNIPLPPGSNSDDYKYILQRILKSAAEEFSPDFYLVDVGFDGHRDDPLSSINLDDQFFEWIAVEMMDLAKSLTIILEGGYDLNALSRSNVKLINGLKNYEMLKDEENKKEKKELPGSSKVHEETKKLFKDIKEIYSPYIEF